MLQELTSERSPSGKPAGTALAQLAALAAQQASSASFSSSFQPAAASGLELSWPSLIPAALNLTITLATISGHRTCWLAQGLNGSSTLTAFGCFDCLQKGLLILSNISWKLACMLTAGQTHCKTTIQAGASPCCLLAKRPRPGLPHNCIFSQTPGCEGNLCNCECNCWTVSA